MGIAFVFWHTLHVKQRNVLLKTIRKFKKETNSYFLFRGISILIYIRPTIVTVIRYYFVRNLLLKFELYIYIYTYDKCGFNLKVSSHREVRVSYTTCKYV
jgi:hypothetical protein